jgi:purine nucleosidase
MNATQFRQQCHAPLLRPVLDFAEVWFKHKDTIVFHDPLAATTIFDDSICTFTPGTVEVEFANEQESGLTRWHPDGTNPVHEVALEVRPERFFAHYFGVF